MTKSRLIMILFGVVLLLCTGLTFRYHSLHEMKPVSGFERGSPSLPRHVLIATQGSQFKDRLVAGIVEQLEMRSVYVKVIDIADLTHIREEDWRAILMLHTWEFGEAPGVVSEFVKRLAASSKVIDITTSESGRERLPGVDVISSASVVHDVPALLVQIEARVDALLTGS